MVEIRRRSSNREQACENVWGILEGVFECRYLDILVLCMSIRSSQFMLQPGVLLSTFLYAAPDTHNKLHCKPWCYTWSLHVSTVHNTKVAPDFGSGKSEIRPFFGNPAKSGSGQISSRMWRMPEQLKYVQFIRPRDKTNAADLSSGVLAIIIGVPRTKNDNIYSLNSLPFHKFGPKLANSDVAKKTLNCTSSL